MPPALSTASDTARNSIAALGLLPALAAILLGAVLIYGVGFAAPALLHNAAHDTRHAFTFPCH